jgi:hypothetical protein
MSQWQRGGKYFWRYGEGYTVSLAQVQGRPVYSAWGPNLPPQHIDPRRPGYGSRANLLGCYATPGEARARVEAEARGATKQNLEL